jgi:hypothetical protein
MVNGQWLANLEINTDLAPPNFFSLLPSAFSLYAFMPLCLVAFI